jgi:hypothetical protein
MTNYNGPPLPDDDEPDIPSDEDVRGLIEENLEETDRVLPPEHAKEISDFLNLFNVKGADEIGYEDLEAIWRLLGQNPSLVKDFTYILTDVKTELTLSRLPVPISKAELIEYSHMLSGNFSPRLWLIQNTVVPNLRKFGFSEARIMHNALGEVHGKQRAGEATRFLGWLAGQSFMSRSVEKFKEYRRENDLNSADIRISHLGMVCTQEVVAALDGLEKRAKKYRNEHTMEIEAQPKHDDVLLAMKGIYNLSHNLLIGKPKQK